MTLTQEPIWQALINHQKALSRIHLSELFARNTQRFNQFSLQVGDLLLDYSKNHLTEETIQLFCQLADKMQLREKIIQLFQGHPINQTENRPALHTALRSFNHSHTIEVNGKNVKEEIDRNFKKMEEFISQIQQGIWRGYSQQPIKQIVNIGIGGSHLGPQLTVEALAPYRCTDLEILFISNIDGHLIDQVLKKLNPQQTLFILSSKSFSTQETLTNAKTAINWFIEKTGSSLLKQHFIAITAYPERAHALGIPNENIFPIWPWVGGRYSIWSSIGLPLALSIGMLRFYEFCKGAESMDQHFQESELTKNMPFILGLTNIWYHNFWLLPAKAILPYHHFLNLLPAYLQQLKMESLGKQINHSGHRISYPSSPIIFGCSGTEAQHSFFQLLHQGTLVIPVDFILVKSAHHSYANHQKALIIHGLSQAKALMDGKDLTSVKKELAQANYTAEEIEYLAPHKVLPGDRPSNTLILSQLSPHTLGALIALYEHQTFIQSVIWDINAFDQWGVELGKELTECLLEESNETLDSSTQGLIEYCFHSKSKL